MHIHKHILCEFLFKVAVKDTIQSCQIEIVKFRVQFLSKAYKCYKGFVVAIILFDFLKFLHQMLTCLKL